MAQPNEDVLDEVLTVSDAARALELPESEVRTLLADGSLRGAKIGGRWLTSVAAVDDLAAELDDEAEAEDEDDDDGTCDESDDDE